MAEHETHEAVVKLARRELEDHERINCWFRPEFVRALIDRLEAAHKREIEATAAKCCQLGRLAGYGASEIKHQQEPVGNAAKLREALKIIRGMTKEELEDLKDISDEVRADFVSIVGWCDHALAAPARNCDVGTTEEQSARMRKFCSKNGLCRDGSYRCENCGFLYDPNCELRWAQLPYEEGGDK